MKKIMIACFAVALSCSAMAKTNITAKAPVQDKMMQSKMKDGVMMKDGKMMMMKDGKTMMMDKDMKMSNGTMVMMDGSVKTKKGKMMKMKEGDMMMMNGKMSKMPMSKM